MVQLTKLTRFIFPLPYNIYVILGIYFEIDHKIFNINKKKILDTTKTFDDVNM